MNDNFYLILFIGLSCCIFYIIYQYSRKQKNNRKLREEEIAEKRMQALKATIPNADEQPPHTDEVANKPKVDIDAMMRNLNFRQERFIEDNLKSASLAVGYTDQQFMQDVMDILENNYADSQFGVRELTEKLNISYTLIYKKLISLTGLSPVRFILMYRLRIAKKILESSKNINIAEIAYHVGFNDPKYFTRCFVKQYKKTPSSMRF